jgi:hypothetical protein
MAIRSVRARINWFRSHKPEAVGMCLRHTWMATSLPAVGKPDANAGWAYVKDAGHLHTDRKPPRGAWVWWSSSTHGHVALSLGEQRILSVDVDGPATTGVRPMTWFETAWGQKYVGWSSWYGVEFPVAGSRTARLVRLRDSLVKRLRAIRAKLRRSR